LEHHSDNMTEPGADQPIPAEMLLLAYRSGIFPMADGREDPDIFWVEPRERAIIPLDGFHMSRSLAKAVRQDRFRVTCNHAFAEVMAKCAEPRGEDRESWISGRITNSYIGLHRAGHAHSIECWQGDTLVGGLYGVQFDRVFCGESMFSRAPDASKIALTWLVALLRQAGAELLDCQFMTEHLATMGAVEISQAQYVDLLGEAGKGEPAQPLPEAYVSLLGAAGSGAGDGAAVARGAGEAAARGNGDSSPGKLIAQSLTQTS